MAARVHEREVELFRQHGGGLRMAETLRLGTNRKTLYATRDAGVVELVSRGLYRLASLDPLAHPDLVTVAKRVPQGALCLIPALSFHELTTQVPHTIDVALERGRRSRGSTTRRRASSGSRGRRRPLIARASSTRAR